MKFELRHDILAQKIVARVSAEDKYMREALQFVHQRYQFFKRKGELLSDDGIDYIKPHLNRLRLSKEEVDFIEKSIADIHQKEIAERERLERKIKRQNQARRRQRYFLIAALAITALVSLLSMKTINTNRELKQSAWQNAITQGNYYQTLQKFEAAIIAYQSPRGWRKNDSLLALIQKCNDLINQKEKFDSVITQIESAYNKRNLNEVDQQLMELKKVNYHHPLAKAQIESLEGKRSILLLIKNQKVDIEQLLTHAFQAFRRRNKIEANILLNVAEEINPKDKRIKILRDGFRRFSKNHNHEI